MAETVDTRVMALAATEGFVYMGFDSLLSRDELAALPTPNGVGATLANGVHSIEEHYDRTTTVGFFLGATPSLRDNETFITYARHVAEHLGGAALDPRVVYVGAGSVIGQVVHGKEPTFRDRTARYSL